MKRSLAVAALAIATAAAANVDMIEGNPESSVKVTIYTDLQCDYCQSLRVMLDEKLLPRYGKQVAFVHRDFPLGRHNWARSAAMAGRWVYEQDPRLKAVYERELLSEQSHITQESLKSWLIQFAGRNKLSEQGIVAAMTDQRLGVVVDSQVQTATARGIKTVPTILIAGKTFSNVIIYDDVARAIDEALPH